MLKDKNIVFVLTSSHMFMPQDYINTNRGTIEPLMIDIVECLSKHNNVTIFANVADEIKHNNVTYLFEEKILNYNPEHDIDYLITLDGDKIDYKIKPVKIYSGWYLDKFADKMKKYLEEF